MIEAKREYDWQHTGHLLWMQAELNRDRKKTPRAYTPQDFMPVGMQRKPSKKDLPQADFSILKALFVKGEENVRYGCTWQGD